MYHQAINMSLVIKRLLEVWSILTHITAVLTNSQNRYKFFFLFISIAAAAVGCTSQSYHEHEKNILFTAFLSIRKPAAASIVAVY